MDMTFSKRATQIEEGIFSILNTKKEELLQRVEKSIIFLWARRILKHRSIL